MSNNDQNGIQPLSKSYETGRYETILSCLTMLSKVQKNYGKTPAELKDEADAFDAILPGNVSPATMRQAFLQYARIYPDVPSPSQIANILDHGYPEPKDGRYQTPTQTEIL